MAYGNLEVVTPQENALVAVDIESNFKNYGRHPTGIVYRVAIVARISSWLLQKYYGVTSWRLLK